MTPSSLTLNAIAFFAALGCAVAQPAVGRIDGIVTDSVHRRPLAGATIIATPANNVRDSVFHAATSDRNGHFAIVTLPAGRYSVAVEHPYIDSTGIGAPAVDVDLEVSGTRTISIGIPSVPTLRRALCPAAVRDTTLGAIVGTVRRTDGTMVSGAAVVFTWSDFEVDRQTAAAQTMQLLATALTDDNGVYRACGLPIARTLIVQAQVPGLEQGGVTEEEIGTIGVLVRDFRIPVDVRSEPANSADSALASPDAPLGKFVVTGRVVTADGKALPSAQVRLFGSSRSTVTNEVGEFRLSGIPNGTQGLEVLALGYFPQRLRVEIDDRSAPVVVRLEHAAVVLDSVRVIAGRIRNNSYYRNSEFDQRMLRGQGRYITEDQIALRRPIETIDLFRATYGFSVAVNKDPIDDVVLSNRGAGGASNKCVMQLFLDGMELKPTDIHNISPTTIHGIEVYSSATAPVKYRIGTCGALLIWSK